MPHNVRNFWLEAKADGRLATVTTGPIPAIGGINITIYQRNHGEVMTAVKIQGRAGKDGVLTLDVWGYDQDGMLKSFTIRTDR